MKVLDAWAKVLWAAVMEVGWVIGLKYAQTGLEVFFTLCLVLASNALLIAAGKTLPIGSAYAAFVGLGTGGAVVVDALFFDNTMTGLQVVFLSCIVAGAVGLQVVTKPRGEEAR